MGRQVWGTYSVKDHCAISAFVADVMLYDRLVIPVPVDDEQRADWKQRGSNPELQAELLEILGDRARQLKWNEERRKRWKARFDAGCDVASETADWAFRATRIAATEDLPRHVTGITAVTSYPSVDELSEDLNLQKIQDQQVYSSGAVAAILGKAFLVPEDPKRTHQDLLRDAVALSSEREFRRRRTSFWRWAREFIDDTGITDQLAIEDAVEEMSDLIADEEKALKRERILTTTKYAFLVGSLTRWNVGWSTNSSGRRRGVCFSWPIRGRPTALRETR